RGAGSGAAADLGRARRRGLRRARRPPSRVGRARARRDDDRRAGRRGLTSGRRGAERGLATLGTRLLRVTWRQPEAWLMDMDGVLVREEHPIEGAERFLARLRELGR